MVKRKKVVTISQVAQAAGVSRSTVSRAFTKPHLIGSKTVEKVKAIARELDYFPNQLARALSTGQYANIAMIVPDVANPFFPPMIRAAQDAAYQSDFCVFLGNSGEDVENEDTLVRRFLSQVDGLILASSRLPKKRLLEFSLIKPVVLINRDIEGIPRVLIDSQDGMIEAVQHLAKRGHKKIAYVSGPEASWSNQSRLSAIQQAVKENNLELVVLPAQLSSYEVDTNIVDKLLEYGASVAIAFDDMTAHDLMGGLSMRGLKVPEDFSIIGCDDVLGAYTSPPLTSISNRSSEAGTLAVSLLFEMLKPNSIKDSRIVLNTQLVVRKSTS